jgi:hypothetical protein
MKVVKIIEDNTTTKPLNQNRMKEIVDVICLTIISLGFMYFMYKMVNIDN